MNPTGTVNHENGEIKLWRRCLHFQSEASFCSLPDSDKVSVLVD